MNLVFCTQYTYSIQANEYLWNPPLLAATQNIQETKWEIQRAQNEFIRIESMHGSIVWFEDLNNFLLVLVHKSFRQEQQQKKKKKKR